VREIRYRDGQAVEAFQINVTVDLRYSLQRRKGNPMPIHAHRNGGGKLPRRTLTSKTTRDSGGLKIDVHASADLGGGRSLEKEDGSSHRSELEKEIAQWPG